jgi:hypothetical protein
MSGGLVHTSVYTLKPILDLAQERMLIRPVGEWQGFALISPGIGSSQRSDRRA